MKGWLIVTRPSNGESDEWPAKTWWSARIWIATIGSAKEFIVFGCIDWNVPFVWLCKLMLPFLL